MARSVGIDRVRVVEAAAQLADAQGLDQLTLAQVAGRLGVRLPSLYNHGAGLAGLRRELALLGMQQLAERIGRAVVGKAGDEALIALAQAIAPLSMATLGSMAHWCRHLHPPTPNSSAPARRLSR